MPVKGSAARRREQRDAVATFTWRCLASLPEDDPSSRHQCAASDRARGDIDFSCGDGRVQLGSSLK